MSEATFWQTLGGLRGWALLPDGRIRQLATVRGFALEVCPVCAVANATVGTALSTETRWAGIALGLERGLVAQVARAADGEPTAIRDRLLAACGLLTRPKVTRASKP